MKFFLLASLLIPILILPAFGQTSSQILPTEKGTLDVKFSTTPDVPNPGDTVKLNIDFINPNSNKIQEHIDYRITVLKDGTNTFGPIPLTHTSVGSVTIPVELLEEGAYFALIEVEGILFQPLPLETVSFTIHVGEANAQLTDDNGETNENGGGCLIATATYGSELSTQVQMLREIRDNSFLQTQSGKTFMKGFNEFYYSFSPIIADYERENPVFKEAVKLTITPLIASLSILNYVDMNSEESVLGYGISLILLNVTMYFVAPIATIYKIKSKN